MVRIFDGNSEIGAHARSNLCYLICLSHLIRSRVTDHSVHVDFFLTKDLFSFIHAQHSELPSKMSTMDILFLSEPRQIFIRKRKNPITGICRNPTNDLWSDHL